jgi:hypothetical protein
VTGEGGLGLDLDQPGGVEQARHDYRGRGRADLAEDLAVRPGDLLPVPGVGEVHPGTDHVLIAGAGLRERLPDQIQAEPGLIVGARRRRRTVGGHRRCPRDDHPVSVADRAGEAEDRLIGRMPGYQFTFRHPPTIACASFGKYGGKGHTLSWAARRVVRIMRG